MAEDVIQEECVIHFDECKPETTHPLTDKTSLTLSISIGEWLSTNKQPERSVCEKAGP